MTEAEWLKEHANAQRMMWTLRDRTKIARTKAGRRKLRLFACECCRLIWKHLKGSGLRAAVKVAERFAEGHATKDELAAARSKILPLTYGGYLAEARGVKQLTAACMCMGATEEQAFSAAFEMVVYDLPLAGYCGDQVQGEAILCDLLRCAFGNPFRTPVIESSSLIWNGGTIPRLAQAISAERAFDRMGILADALEEAGCTDINVLSHCRGSGPHTSVCWVIEAILGQK